MKVQEYLLKTLSFTMGLKFARSGYWDQNLELTSSVTSNKHDLMILIENIIKGKSFSVTPNYF